MASNGCWERKSVFFTDAMLGERGYLCYSRWSYTHAHTGSTNKSHERKRDRRGERNVERGRGREREGEAKII